MKKTSLAILASLTIHASMFAVSVSTSPVGFINLTIKGTDSGGMTAVSAPMLPQVEYSGVISSAAGFEITDDSATWSDSQYPVYDPDDDGTDYEQTAAYYVEITSGAEVGKTLGIYGSDSASKKLTVGEDVSGLDLVGASYSIRKYTTLGDVFGDDEDNTKGGFVLNKGSDFAAADLIYKIGYKGGVAEWQKYYYQTAITVFGGNGWRSTKSKFVDVAGTPIKADEGLIVRRRTAEDVSVTLPGTIKNNDSRTSLLSGFNLVAVSFPVSRKLTELNLTNDLVSGSDDAASDVIYVINDAGKFKKYYYQTAISVFGGTGWRVAGDKFTSQDEVEIKPGQAVIIRRGSNDQVDWSLGKPF